MTGEVEQNKLIVIALCYVFDVVLTEIFISNRAYVIILSKDSFKFGILFHVQYEQISFSLTTALLICINLHWQNHMYCCDIISLLGMKTSSRIIFKYFS